MTRNHLQRSLGNEQLLLVRVVPGLSQSLQLQFLLRLFLRLRRGLRLLFALLLVTLLLYFEQLFSDLFFGLALLIKVAQVLLEIYLLESSVGFCLSLLILFFISNDNFWGGSYSIKRNPMLLPWKVRILSIVTSLIKRGPVSKQK